MSAGQQRGSLERPALLDRDPAQRERLTWLLIGLALLWPMLKYSEFSPGGLLDAQSMQSVGTFLASFLPPRLDAEFLWLLAEATLVTVAIATSGLALGWVLAVPLTLLATARLSQSSIGRPMRPLATFARQAVRALLIFLRSVPELVWALLFVRVVGLGPTAGVLAIALTYAGMLGKVYAEVLESGDGQATEALLRNGSGRMSAFLYGALPQNANELVSYTVFRWECAVRSSVIMGFVGGGGLGQQMDLSMKMLAGGEVSMILLMFVLLVALADRISLLLRRALDGHEATRPTAGSAGVISAEPPARLQATEASLPPRPAQRAGWLVVLPLAVLVVLSFAVLDLRFEGFLEDDALSKMGEFIGGFFPPETDPGFLSQLWQGSLETLAMSALGTLIAAVIAVAIALPASMPARGLLGSLVRRSTRLALNLLRSIPELVWASLWVIAAGLGPFPGTLALAAHTAGVLGRLFADTFENLPPAPARVLRENGSTRLGAILYASLPQALPQLMSYTLYRWENNIRAAAVLGVVGAGGLGQILHLKLSLFQMHDAAGVVLAMLVIVACVDVLSYFARRRLSG